MASAGAVESASGAGPTRPRANGVARLLVYLLALVPALLLFRAVDRNAVNVPVWDDWQFVSLVEKVHGGEIPWSELPAPHDEHRLLLPRILIVASLLLSGGNYRVQCFISVGVMVILSLALLSLLRRTLGAGRIATPFVWGLANLVLFSPIQLHNWLWPMQLAYFLPFGFMALCLAAFYSDRGADARLALCGVCAWAASYSFINGLLLWPVMLPAILRDRRWTSGREKRLFAGAWLASAALVAALYFHGLLENTADIYYQPGLEGPPGSERVPATIETLRMLEQQPLATLARAAQFIVTMYGNAISRGFSVSDPVALSAVCGAVLLAVGVGLWLALSRSRRLEGAAYAWTSLLLYAFLTAGLVSVGRLWDGPTRPLTPRYATYGSFCLLAVVMLAGLAAAGREAEKPRAGAPRARDLAFLGAGILIAMLGVNWAYGLDLMTEWRETRLQTRAVIHFTRHPNALRGVFRAYPTFLEGWAGGRTVFLAERIATLDRLGYWQPPLAADLRLDQFEISEAPLRTEHAGIDRVERRRRGVLKVHGHAHYGSSATPHLILFTSFDGNGTRVIREACLPQSPPRWRYAGLGMDRQFLFLADHSKRYYGRFGCEIHPKAIPPGEPREMEVWGLDFARGRVRRIQAEIHLPEGALASP